MTGALTALDRQLLNILQEGIEPVARPFAAIATATGLSEEAIVERIAGYLRDGLLTRFGPLFNADRMGGAFCLCAMDVPAERFDEVCDTVNAFSQVAHNYKREHRYNMWFVLATETPQDIEATGARIEAWTGLPVVLFPKEAEYFIGLKVPA